MIRWCAWMLSLALLALSLFVSYWAYDSRTSKATRFPFINLPIVVMNDSGKGVPLFSSNDPYGDVTGTLASDDYYRFFYAGDNGSWLYGKDVVIKDPSRKKALLIAGLPIKLEFIQQSYVLAVMVFLVASAFRIKQGRRINAALKQALAVIEQERQERKHAENRVSQKEQEIRASIGRERSLEKDLASSNQLLSQREQEIRQISEKQKLLLQSYEAREANLKSYLASVIETQKVAFQQKEWALKKQFEEDANDLQIQAKNQVRVEISRMQASYDRLNNQYQSLKADYQQLKTEGVVFDIDFDSDNYENLLKGRLFEIYFAKSLVTDSKFEVLRWTSDKGFENGIKVKSNGDPDFVIQYNNELVFAVECKYRSNFYGEETPSKVEWGSSRQAQRYKDFQQEHKVPVFVAAGVKNKPDNPKHLYLVALNYLSQVSNGRYWKDNKKKQKQEVANCSDIDDLCIDQTDNFSEKALQLIYSQLNQSVVMEP